MAIVFRAEDGSAVCDRDALRILFPRVWPGRSESEVELKFTVFVGDARSGVAFVGRQRPPSGQNPAFFDVRLDPERALAQILRIRETVAAPETPLDYIFGFARGLLAVCGDGRNLWEDTAFQVSVAPQTLASLGFESSIPEVALDGDRMVLASDTVRSLRGVVVASFLEASGGVVDGSEARAGIREGSDGPAPGPAAY